MPGAVTMRNQVRVVKDAHMLILPCALCGVPLAQFAVEDAPGARTGTARRLFRATTLPDGRVYVPTKHAHPGECPDPPSTTEKFWQDDEAREAWKRQRRGL